MSIIVIDLFVQSFIIQLFFSAEKALERDKFMSPDEARDFGLIDRVLSHPPPMDNTSSSNGTADS